MKKSEKMMGGGILLLVVIWAVMYLPGEENKDVSNYPKNMPAALNNQRSVPDYNIPVPEEANTESSVVSQEDILERVLEQMRLKNQSVDMTLIVDPFKEIEPIDVPLDFDDLFLVGISMLPENTATIINNRILKEGDEIFGFEVREIRNDEVILYKDLQRYILRFEIEEADVSVVEGEL